MKEGRIDHQSFLVKNIEEKASHLSKLLGVGFEVWTITPKKCRYRTSNETYSYRVAIATIGSGKIELIQPVAGESHLSEQLSQQGEGNHHTAFTFPNYKAFDNVRKALISQDYLSIQFGKTEGFFEFEYFEMPELGTIIELLWVEQMPESDGTIFSL